MAWIVLVLSGICEAVWAVALDKSQGFTKIIPVIVFFCGLAASMAGLSYAMRSISVDRLCDLGRYRGRDHRGVWHGRVHRRPQIGGLTCTARASGAQLAVRGLNIDLCGGGGAGIC